MRALWPVPALFAGFLAALLSGLPAAGAEEVGSLGRGIPDDYFFYVHRWASPDREFLREPLAALARAARESDLPAALLDALGEEALGGLAPVVKNREESAQWRKVLAGVDWAGLLRREYAVGARFDISWRPTRVLDAASSIDWLLLFRVDGKERDAHLKALRQVLLALGTLGEEVDPETGRRTSYDLIDGRRDGVPTTVLLGPDGATRLCLGGQAEVLALSNSSAQLRRSLGLLSGEASGRAVPDGDDFRRLLAGLPPPSSGELLLRPRLITTELRAMARVVGEARVPKELAEVVEQRVRGLEGLGEGLDVFGAIALSETTAGNRLLGTYRGEPPPEAEKKPLYKALLDRPPLDDFRRMVPRDAVGFAVSTGPDLEKLHDALEAFVQKVVPDGSEVLDGYRRVQEKSGFDVKRDLLSLIDGESVFLTFPAREGRAAPAEGAMPAGILQCDRVALVKLKQAAAVESKLDGLLERAADGLRAVGMGIEPAEVPDVPGKFRRIALPFPPGLEVTFGVSGDQFALGTSRDRIREAFLVRSGKVESIEKNAEFARLGLDAGGRVHSVAYRDLGDLGGRLETSLKAAGLLGALLPEGKKGGEPSPRKLLGLLPRLAPIVGALRFSDQAGISLVEDGKGFRGQAVLSVKPGAAKADAEAAPAEKKRTL